MLLLSPYPGVTEEEVDATEFFVSTQDTQSNMLSTQKVINTCLADLTGS